MALKEKKKLRIYCTTTILLAIIHKWIVLLIWLFDEEKHDEFAMKAAMFMTIRVMNGRMS